MKRIAENAVQKHVVAAYGVAGTPETRFFELLKRTGSMWRVKAMGFVFTDFEAMVIKECRKQAGL